MAFFNPEPRTANAKALVDTELLEISYQDVQKEFEKFPVWVKILLNTMSSQVHKYGRELKQYRIADSNDPEAFNGNVLKYLAALLQALQLFGHPEGKHLIVDKSALKLVSIHLAQLAPHRMNQLAKALGAIEGFKYKEEGDEFTLEVASAEPLHLIARQLAYYVSSHPHLLHPTLEDLQFLKALATLTESQTPDHRGLVKVNAGPLMEELKKLGSKANMTLVDSLIDLGLPLQKQSGEGGVDIVFPQEDVKGLFLVWDFLTEMAKQNPFKS
jgi:hypothetical protein